MGRAVGRTFEADAPNISIGILSALNRVWSKAIQTDAKVSPSNYGGPLIDIQGRVYGILVPLSPQQQTEVAGAEWYDSGIGFAIPMVDLKDPIERMKAGNDLYRGILGVTLKGGNMFSDAAEVAISVRNSPAAKAGIKPKDRIIRIDDHRISRQTHLKHALGPRYAGETVRVVVIRKGKRLEFDVELAAQVDPYARPYLGILPIDANENRGVLVRYVLPGSPAMSAGLKPGDRITGIDNESVVDGETLRELLANREPGQGVVLTIFRSGDEQSVSVELSSEPEEVPTELPDRPTGDGENVDFESLLTDTQAEEAEADQAEGDAGDEQAEQNDGEKVHNDPKSDLSSLKSKVVSIKVAAEPNECFALIPPTYRESRPHGVVIWLSAPSKFDEQQFVQRWSDLAARHHLIVMTPQPSDSQRWVVTESPVVAKLFKQLDRDYTIDPHRVVIHGYQGGASLAYRFAFENRDIVHGVAAVDAAVPIGVQPRGNDSIEHLAFWIHTAKGSRRSERVRKNVERFRAMKFPVTDHTIEGDARYLNPAELGELARWVDILDRI